MFKQLALRSHGGGRLVRVAHEAAVSAAEDHLSDPEAKDHVRVRFVSLRIREDRWVDERFICAGVGLDGYGAQGSQRTPVVEPEGSCHDDCGEVDAAESRRTTGSTSASVERPGAHDEKHNVCSNEKHRDSAKIVNDRPATTGVERTVRISNRLKGRT